MKEKKMKRLLAHIEDLEERLCEADNNLRYIKVLKALKLHLERLSALFDKCPEGRAHSYDYARYFTTGAGWSFYDRVCNSILDYQYGNRPF